MEALTFLREEYPRLLADLDPNTPPRFGKMNVHQMIEHMTDAFRQASGLLPQDPLNDEAVTARMYSFMMSAKPFRDNTPNPYIGEEPATPRTASVKEAIKGLKEDIGTFVQTFEQAPDKRIQNPFFGNLNFQEWTHLLYKHAWHHLRQFGHTLPETFQA